MAKNTELYVQYRDSLKNLQALHNLIKNEADSYSQIDLDDESADFETRYKIAKLRVEMDLCTAKIKVQEDMMNVYNDRIAEYRPIFEEESRITNENWNTVWEQAQSHAAKNPFSLLGMIVMTHQKNQDEAESELVRQERKNEAYKGMVEQLKKAKSE